MKKAVFTYVYSDIPFIDVWLRHYTRYFDDIYIFNIGFNNILDKYKNKYKFTEIKVEKDFEYKAPYVLDIIEAKYKEYLKDFQWVMYSDIDEIILPNPALYTSFEHYIQEMKQPYLYCHGFEVLHEQEPEIIWDRPLLMQREYWLRQPVYDKPLLTSVPLKHVEGLHEIEGSGDPKRGILQRGDQSLFLIHIHRIDNLTKAKFSKREHFKGTDSKEKIPMIYKTLI